MTIEDNGNVMQSGLTSNRARQVSEGGATKLCLGIILNIRWSDDEDNKSAGETNEQRGYRTEAEVLIINDGGDALFRVPDCVVLPCGASGMDNFHEELPLASDYLVDGTRWDGNMNVDTEKLVGDRCIVAFIGGNTAQPVMLSWYPHPSNRHDPATIGLVAGETSDTLVQGRRLLKRYAGMQLTVTSKGSVFLDTNESNSALSPTSAGTTRKKRDEGGDVVVSVKSGRRLEVNFNPTVPDPDEPSLPQPNPPQGRFERSTANTTVRFTDSEIELIAKEAVKIISQNTDIILQPAVNLLLGSEEATENLVLGQLWKTLMSSVLGALMSHTHGTGVGPSGPPLPPELTTFTTEKTGVDNGNQLSDFIFAQKIAATTNGDE